jgi:gas vesicle protein
LGTILGATIGEVTAILVSTKTYCINNSLNKMKEKISEAIDTGKVKLEEIVKESKGKIYDAESNIKEGENKQVDLKSDIKLMG